MVTLLDQLLECTGFEWDQGNIEKNWLAHKVAWTECEEAFLNRPLLVTVDLKHSGREPRFYALGQTDAQRLLQLVFTIRKKRTRVISARDMSKRERKEYQYAQSEEAGSEEDTGF
jgi:hypothetical protein